MNAPPLVQKPRGGGATHLQINNHCGLALDAIIILSFQEQFLKILLNCRSFQLIFCFGRLFAPNLLKDLEWALDLGWFKFGLDQNKVVVFMVRFSRP